MTDQYDARQILELALIEDLAKLRDLLAAAKSNLAKLLGTVRTYLAADPQIRGEAYRDMAETVAWLDGERDDLCGWPACYEREKQRAEAAEKERDELRAKLAEIEAEQGAKHGMF